MEVSKRPKGKNFTMAEKSLLIDIVDKYKNILENRKMDGVTNITKKECWATVAEEFNANLIGEEPRSADQLKQLYKNLKRNIRNELASGDMEMDRTSVGNAAENYLVNECRQRWSRIKENHRKALQLRNTKSEPTALRMRVPKYDKELSFLLPYTSDEKAGYYNIESPQSSALASDDETSNNDPLHEVKMLSESEEPVPSASRSTNVVNTHHEVNQRLEQPPPVAVMQNFLDPKKTNVNMLSVADDPLTSFFVTMAQTVKTFPLCDQIKIKGDIFRMVHEVEMGIAANATSTQGAHFPTSEWGHQIPGPSFTKIEFIENSDEGAGI